MNMKLRIRKSAVVVLLGLMVTACGGGGGSDGGGSGPTDDINGTGVVAGSVTGFGSVIVNGIRINTASSTFSNDGDSISQDDLDIGDRVIIRGTFSGDGTGTATSVTTDEFVKGSVDSVDVPNKLFVAMGQTVRVDLGTVFDGVTLETLAAGQLVEVHGTLNGSDQIVANRVELKTSLDEYEVTGFIDTLDTGSQVFTINGLTVNYALASVETESGTSLQTGMYVDVESSTAPVGGVLAATSVEEENEFEGVEEGDEAELQGIITQVDSSTQFVMNGITVIHGAGTSFEGGSAADLVVDAEVEVEGSITSSGVLQAEEIEIKQDENVRIMTTVDAVNSTAGTLTILGLTIQTGVHTQFEDDSDAEVNPFSLSQLNPGDYVELRATIDSSGLTATRVERDNLDTVLELRGPLDSNNGTDTMVILGLTVMTDASTSFEDQNDNTISSAEFYATVGAGDVVEIEQDPAGGPIVAGEVSIEELAP